MINFISYDKDLNNYVLDYTPIDTFRGIMLQKILKEGKTNIMFYTDMDLIKKNVVSISYCNLGIDIEQQLESVLEC